MKKLYTDDDYFNMACQANEEGKKLIKVQEEIDVPFEVYEYEKKIIQVPIYNDKGEIIGYEEKEVDDLTKPIMVEEKIINPETGEEETILVHKHHTEYRKEIVERLEIVDNPENFQRCFFNTSLGYVSRTVHNLNGKTEDFLNDTLPALQTGIPIITYNADKTQNVGVIVTEEFLDECKQQKYKDFYGGNSNLA